MCKKELGHLCSKIAKDLTGHDLPYIRYFQYDLRRYVVLFKVMENFYLKKNYTQEKILESIPSHLSSRSNLLNIINFAFKEGYFEKNKINNNLRAKTIHPSPALEEQFKKWLKILHRGSENIKNLD